MTAYLEIEDAARVVDRFGFHVLNIGVLASALARLARSFVGVAAVDIPLEDSAGMTAAHLVKR
ncbi:hypothetical protein [Arthrobacter sp. 754]|uniref:hypothetical protein n=1 Tax=Arthrobacter sp. 754 TaxID=3156315 RepID=UPI003399F1C5